MISNGGTDQILDNENLPVVRNTRLFNFTCDVLTRSFITLIQKKSEEFRNQIIRRMQNKEKESRMSIHNLPKLSKIFILDVKQILKAFRSLGLGIKGWRPVEENTSGLLKILNVCYP